MDSNKLVVIESFLNYCVIYWHGVTRWRARRMQVFIPGRLWCLPIDLMTRLVLVYVGMISNTDTFVLLIVLYAWFLTLIHFGVIEGQIQWCIWRMLQRKLIREVICIFKVFLITLTAASLRIIVWGQTIMIVVRIRDANLIFWLALFKNNINIMSPSLVYVNFSLNMTHHHLDIVLLIGLVLDLLLLIEIIINLISTSFAFFRALVRVFASLESFIDVRAAIRIGEAIDDGLQTIVLTLVDWEVVWPITLYSRI